MCSEVEKLHRDCSTRNRGGRPSLEQQKLRRSQLLTVALDVFAENGFEETTVEQIVVLLGMSKATVYALYDNKTALFKAALRFAIEREGISREELISLPQDCIATALQHVGFLHVRRATMPKALRLRQVLATQIQRFPDLAPAAMGLNTGPIIQFITDLIDGQAPAGSLAAADSRRAATTFLNLVSVSFMQSTLHGYSPGDDEIRESVDYNVRVFLAGVGLDRND